tara:strand:+ start:388 stop:618 length:231 start_codon:yes stop_codon:yes gene_type:complete
LEELAELFIELVVFIRPIDPHLSVSKGISVGTPIAIMENVPFIIYLLHMISILITISDEILTSAEFSFASDYIIHI